MANSVVNKDSNSLRYKGLYAVLGFLAAGALAGLIVYAVLWATSISPRISIPYSILTGVIVFSLANYYGTRKNIGSSITIKRLAIRFGNATLPITELAFALIFLLFLMVLLLDQRPGDNAIFIDWNKLTPFDVFHLTAGIAISIYIPGFALVSIFDRRNNIDGMGKHLLAYLFSIFVSGIIGLAVAASGQPFQYYSPFIITIYFLILALFIVIKLRPQLNGDDKSPMTNNENALYHSSQIVLGSSYWVYVIFACLLIFVVLSSYYLFGATLIGDQLFHHGRAMTFLDGSFRTLVSSGSSIPYLPLMHSFLASLFSLSEIPSVNVYITIGFLNIMPVFAFYYFFSKWFPFRQKAAILATCLFMLGSGFGWVHVITLTGSSDVTSSESVFDLIDLGGRNTFDVRLPNAFLNNGSVTKPLILFALPCGLVLLGLIKQKMNSKILLFSVVFIIVFAGLISHEEFIIFLIVALIVQVIFKNDNSGYFFAAISLSICTVWICLAAIFPPESQVIREVLGIQFTILLLILTLICWSLFTLRVRSKDFFRERLCLSNIKFNRRTNFFIGVGIVALISYLYLFTFVTWSQIPFSDIHAQVSEQGAKIVPWYLYPMRFGVPGLLGLAYLLLYFFKKYERETFIFLIIAAVAIVFTPFYNEYRLNRYLMMAAAGLSALLVYIILNHISNKRQIITGFIISGVIASSGMSIIMYQGYIDLALQNPDVNMFMAHRYFPNDISLLNFIHNNTDPRIDNIAVPNYAEHHFRRHQPESALAEQIEGYAGIPLDNRISHASSILQTSTLEGFFNLVNYSNTKFIVFPRDYISNAPTEIGKFVLTNFPKVYSGAGGVIVSVPRGAEENLPSEVSLVLPQKAMANHTSIPINMKAVNSTRTLTYSNLSNFIVSTSSDVNKAYLSDTNSTIILSAGNTPIDAWRNESIDSDTGYFEVDLKVNSSQTGQSHGGLVLEYGNKTYYIFLRPHSVSVYNNVDKEFVRNNNFVRQQNVWYNLKIVSNMADNSYDVYINNEWMLSFPKLESQNIIRVGVRAINTITEFSPIKVGIPLEEKFMLSSTNPDFDKSRNYYYPLSSAWLARMNYSTFFESDLGATSSKIVILTFDPENIDKYLQYAQEGGTVVILNSNDNFSSGFSKFFKISPMQLERFNEIQDRNGSAFNDLNGRAMNISVKSPSTAVTSFYTASEQNGSYSIYEDSLEKPPLDSSSSLPFSSVSSSKIPFSLEKKHGNGTIIFVNARGLFDAIEQGTQSNSILALESIPELIGLNYSKIGHKSHIQNTPPIRFIGDMYLDGNVTIAGHQLYLPVTDEFSVDRISIINKTKNYLILGSTDLASPTHLQNIRLSKPFSITVNASDVKYMPGISPNSYSGFEFSSGFDMTMRMTENSSLRLDYSNGTTSSESVQTRLGEGNMLVLKNVTSRYTNTPSVVLMTKNPSVQVDGITEIRDFYLKTPDDPSSWLANGEVFRHEGNLTLKLAHTEKFQPIDGPDSYATYLDFIDYEDKGQHKEEKNTRYQKLAIPGDVSAYAKENRISIPIEQILFSETNKKALYSFTIVAVVAIYLSWGKIKTRITHSQNT